MASQQDNPTYEYFAFISYKREDEKWAKWLQKKLESYSLPTAIRKENPELPNKIRPVFRDQSELAGGNLKTEIEKGLNSSKYLIVICSPRSAKSPWVSKEVQHFIDQGRENYIIPFIIGGTPNASIPEDECFPEGLRHLNGEKEILGININEMGREAAAIKVVARMFNLRFDVLWQRFGRVKRARIISSICMAVVLLIIAVIVALILWSNNRTIANQNSRLSQLVDNLQEENITISQIRNRSERYSYTGSLQGNSSDLWLMYIDFHPNEPLIAFSDDWGVWLHYINSNKEILLSLRDDEYETVDIEGISFSTDGSELLMSSMGGTYVWNIDDVALVNYISRDNDDTRDSLIVKKFPHFNCNTLSINLEQLNTQSKYNYTFKDNILTATLLEHSKSTGLESFNDGRITIIPNPKYDEILFVGHQRTALFDEKENNFVQFFKGYDSSDFLYSSNGDYLLIGKDIFTRRFEQSDTIKVESYDISSFNNSDKKEAPPKNTKITNVSVVGEYIEYKYNKKNRSIHVLKPYTSGNGQEYLASALLCNANKIIAIVEQGNHRVYNALTGELIGRLENYVWDENPLGYEGILGHWNSYIINAQNIGRYLYSVSSGGIIRIYDIDKLVLKRVIELPLDKCVPSDEPQCHIDTCIISPNGKSIKFKFANYNTVYECVLPR